MAIVVIKLTTCDSSSSSRRITSAAAAAAAFGLQATTVYINVKQRQTTSALTRTNTLRCLLKRFALLYTLVL